MKIAFFSDCYLDLTGGIVSSINAQKAALEADGHEVYVFSTGFPRSKKELARLAKQHIYMVPSCRWLFRGLTPVSRRPRVIEKWLLKDHPEIKDFDIFYVHYEAGCSIAALRLGRELKIPTVQVMHGREDKGETNIMPFGLRTVTAILLNRLHSWYLPHGVKISRDNLNAKKLAEAKMWELMVNHANTADLVLTPSAHFRKKLLHYGVTRPIEVFYNGYPDANFPKKAEIKKLEDRQELRMIWHSRVSAEKRMMPFLMALEILQRSTDRRFRMDVYGGGGDYFRAKRFARRHRLRVVFHGNAKFNVVQKAILDSHLDVLVSYDFDTFGMTLIEAEVALVPVLICDPDMREIVPKGSYVISENESPAAMAKALKNLLEHPEKIQQMSKIMLANRDEVLISGRIKQLEQIFTKLKNNVI